MPPGDHTTRAAGPPTIRRLNGLSSLAALQQASSLTASELMAVTGLSRASAHAVCDELIHRGWVRELDPTAPSSASGLGRPSRTFAFNAQAGYVLGIDLGASTVSAHLCDLRGDAVATAVKTVEEYERPAASLIDDAQTLAKRVLADADLTPTRVLTVALGVPAPVGVTGRVLQPNVAVPGLEEVDLVEAFRLGMGTPVLVENDANLAVLGERWRGVAQGSDNAVLILAGERLGAGIVEGGRLVRGHAGEAGELGFLSLVHGVGDTRGAGTIAREMGAQAAAEYERRSRRSRHRRGARIAALAGSPERVQAHHVFQAAQDKDGAALDILATVAERMARAIAVLSTLLDPEVVVIGGAVAAAGEVLLEPMARQLDALTRTRPRLAASALGDRAVVTGAVRLALDHVLARLLTDDRRPSRVVPS